MTSRFKFSAAYLVILGAVALSTSALASGVDDLGKSLTPLGAERAGNADKSIPAWEGGYTAVDPTYQKGGKRGDPFAADKPLFSITSKNMDQYAEKLSDGVKEMFKRYPDTYRLDIYPTRRTAAAPQWVYDNTAKNATNTKLIEGSAGPMPQGAYGGIPFPIPKSGDEAMWNHLLSWRGTSVSMDSRYYLVTADGERVMTTDGRVIQQMPYYFEEGSAQAFDGDYWMIRLLNIGPPIRAGEQAVDRANIDADKSQTHIYLAGQRRVRKVPNSCCDTPAPSTAGVMAYDELSVYKGRLNRFNWKLVGKKEIYIPYNTNKLFTANKPEDVLGKRHLNPDAVRWELHRVWVVEADLKPGQRHQMPKSRYYLDEDTWQAVLGERWDGSGQLAKMLWAMPAVMPDIPAVATVSSGFYDFTSGAWFVLHMFAGKPSQYEIVDRYKNSDFSPSVMAGQGVR